MILKREFNIFSKQKIQWRLLYQQQVMVQWNAQSQMHAREVKRYWLHAMVFGVIVHLIWRNVQDWDPLSAWWGGPSRSGLVRTGSNWSDDSSWRRKRRKTRRSSWGIIQACSNRGSSRENSTKGLFHYSRWIFNWLSPEFGRYWCPLS